MPEPKIAQYARWRQNVGQDPAKYLVDPGSVGTPGGLRHPRPYLVNGKMIFIFPVGPEGFHRSGQAQLGLHHYIGDNAVDGVTVHYEEARIELSGTFPGITSQDNMVECINILRTPPQDPGLILRAPGVFDNEAYCLPESWDFSHDSDDRTHSIDYTITLVRLGEGKKLKDPHGAAATPNPTVRRGKSRGKSSRIFTVKDNARTFRAISNIVYGTPAKWQKILQLNGNTVGSWWNSIPTYQLPTFRWPVGTKFRY